MTNEKINEISQKVIELLADDNCTVAEAEMVFKNVKAIIATTSLVQSDD